MQKRSNFKWLLRAALCLAVCLICAFSASAKGTAQTDSLLAKVQLPKVLGDGKFQIGDVEFNHLLIPRYVIEQYDDSDYAVYPGETDDHVTEVKRYLFSNDNFPKNEYVTYTQVRPPKADGESREWIETYFDEHLATLLRTLYLFCGLEDKEPCIDELTRYLLDCLPQASLEMRWDIEAVYKYTLVKEGNWGTVGRDGTLDHLYYFAQTDPDWAREQFDFYKNDPDFPNGVTIQDRGCGCACASMVFSAYHMVEITPRITANYADAGSWHVSYGLPNEYFQGIARYYYSFEKERYGTELLGPKILSKDEVNMETLADQIGNKGYLAIIHVKSGAFTSQEHYMVLADYREIDGKGYFLVADPYMQSSRYGSRDQLLAVEGSTNDGLIYATADLLYRDCKSLILFEQDRNDFPLYCRTSKPESGWLN